MLLLPLLVSLLLALSARSEKFTALVELGESVSVESEIADLLDLYAERESQRIENVRRYAADLRAHAELMQKVNAETYLANPVNAFLTTARFTTKLQRQLNSLVHDRSAEQALNEELEFRKDRMPNEADLSGATEALLRLQDTYKIPAQLLARGLVHQSQNIPFSEMSAEDCFHIGQYVYERNDFYHAGMWMEEALARLTPHFGTDSLNRTKILDYLSYVLFQQGNLRQALVLTNEWLTIEPYNSRALLNRDYFEAELNRKMAAGAALMGENSTQDDPIVANRKPPDNHLNFVEFKNYEALCRNEDIIPYKYARLLTCRYYVPHPAYLIGPVKEEVMHLHPRIVVWHKILHPSEMARFKELAYPRLNRATVQNAITGKLEYAQYRISKSAWLRNELDEVAARINKRIERLTHLAVETAEELQVVNYGIGGHYEPHFDFARRREKNAFEAAVGNRIATLLYYMSDVEAGGATVFVHLGVKLWPQAGSAAFWYNLKHNGEGDLSTRHAACPVLVGSKWVMNKWFHERGQEFMRPCATSNVEYEY